MLGSSGVLGASSVLGNFARPRLNRSSSGHAPVPPRPQPELPPPSTAAPPLPGYLAGELSEEVHSLATIKDIIASSFAAAQKALAESHESALCLLAKCVDDAHGREEPPGSVSRHVCRQVNSAMPDAGQACEVVSSDGSFSPASEKEGAGLAMCSAGSSTTPNATMGPAGFTAEPGRTALMAWSRQHSPAAASPDSRHSSAPFKPPTKASVAPSSPSGKAPGLPFLPQDQTAEDDKGSDSGSDKEDASVLGTALQRRTLPCASRISEAKSVSFCDDVGSNSEDGSEHNAQSPALARDRSRKVTAQSRRPSLESRVSGVSAESKSETFQLLNVWTNWTTGVRSRRKGNTIKRLSRSMSTSSLESMDLEEQNRRRCKITPLSPGCSARSGWDIASLVLVIYDMVLIPLQLFEIEETAFSEFMTWTTRIFWTADVGMSFSTSHVNPDGSVETSFCRIARHYLSTWFTLDLLLVGSDWVEVLWSDGSFLGFARASKASRTFRIIRMVRLLRLARMRNVFSLLTERIQSEQLMIVAGIIRIMLVIMGLGHVIACVWYGIATQDRADTWTKVHNFEDASLDFKYTTALHWSLLQFAGGTDEIVPQNTGERVYSILVFLLAFIMAAVFVGRLTSSMTQLHMLASKDLEKFHVLKRYLHKNQISTRLSMRVQHNAQHALHEKQRFMEESRVELLSMISEPLRVELHFELYAPVLSVHRLFHVYTEVCPQVIRKVCHAAMSQLLASAGDILFMVGEAPSEPRMLIVCSGKLTYHYVTGAVLGVDVGHCISEAALWTKNWSYRGMLTAASDCRLCILNSNKFQDIADTFDHPDFDLKRYARAFVEALNSGTMAVSDMPWEEECEELVDAVQALTRGVEKPTLVEQQTSTLEWGGFTAPPSPGGTPSWGYRLRCWLTGRSSFVEDLNVVPGMMTPRRSVLMTPA